MTNQEFSNEFDILYNNIMSNQAPGLDEYEKSVFLTQAQEEVVQRIYNGNNNLGESFEKTEESRRYLDRLIKTETLKPLTVNEETSLGLNTLRISSTSLFFKLPVETKVDPDGNTYEVSKVWFITYELAKIGNKAEDLCINGKTISVVPTTLDEYYKIKKNPFKGAGVRRALRLDNNSNVVEIVTKYLIDEYTIRYMVRPKPIILFDLEPGLTINGETTKNNCELSPVIHRSILQRAVELASAAFKLL